MRARGGGRIIQIGSDLFERAAPGMSAHSAAKGARFVTGERLTVNGGHTID